jgi:hypothetical protein
MCPFFVILSLYHVEIPVNKLGDIGEVIGHIMEKGCTHIDIIRGIDID